MGRDWVLTVYSAVEFLGWLRGVCVVGLVGWGVYRRDGGFFLNVFYIEVVEVSIFVFGF